MIITAQLFFNELELLELNCRNLAGAVDAHVIVEARTTFTGLPKPLHFEENKERFRGLNIIHEVIELDPRAESAWHREGESHQKLLAAVKKVAPEIVIWSDADELMDPACIGIFKANGGECMTLEMDHLIYYFDRVRPDIKDQNGKIAYFMAGRPNQPWRGETHWPLIYEAGWHLEYMGQRDHLAAKLAAISHAPEEGCVEMRRRVLEGERPGIDATVHYPLTKLPLYVQNNPGLYAHHFSK